MGKKTRGKKKGWGGDKVQSCEVLTQNTLVRIPPDNTFSVCYLVLAPVSGPSKRTHTPLSVNQRHPSANLFSQRFKTQDQPGAQDIFHIPKPVKSQIKVSQSLMIYRGAPTPAASTM